MKLAFCRRGTRFLLLATPFLLSCGDSSGTGPPEEEAPGPANMTVAPEQITVDVLGETIQYTATVWDELGRVIPDAPLTWYSSDEAVVQVDSGGLAAAVGDGTATVLAAAAASVFGWGEVTVLAEDMDISTTSLPPGITGLTYSFMLEGIGVVSPSWSVVGGSFPQGLALDGGSGEISGTPTVTGSYSFTVQLSGAGGMVTKTLSITVASGEFGTGFGDGEFAMIPAGSFQMGSESGRNHEQPVHTVNITEPFEMLKTEVTQHQWMSLMETNPSGFLVCGQICPLENATWQEVQDFLLRLNAADPGRNYRLPTEAQWEYAARAGTTGAYGGTGVLDEMGWYQDNAFGFNQFVALKLPNDWGLYDMHGNVEEWVQDWYSESYYGESVTDNPTGPPTGTYRGVRGGSAGFSADRARSASRGGGSLTGITARRTTRGFRVIRNAPPTSQGSTSAGR